MNTPTPCDTCGMLYADCMQKDNPDHQAECMDETGKAKWGDLECPRYRNYKTGPMWYEVDRAKKG